MSAPLQPQQPVVAVAVAQPAAPLGATVKPAPIAVAVAQPAAAATISTTTTTSTTSTAPLAPAAVHVSEQEARANEKELAKMQKQHEKEVVKEQKMHEKEVKLHEKEVAKEQKLHEKEQKQHEKELAKEDKQRRKSLAAEEKKLDKERRAAEEAARKARTAKFRAEEEATRARLRADVAAWDLRHMTVAGSAPVVATHHESLPDNLDFTPENVGLFVAVARGRNLVDLDVGLKSDPYVRVLLTSPAMPIHGTQHAGGAVGGVMPASMHAGAPTGEVIHASHQSHHISNNLNPEWYFHVDDTPHLLTDNHDWLQYGRLRIEIWDHDIGTDEFMGYIEFPLTELDGKVTRGDFALQLDPSKAGKKLRKSPRLGDIYVEIRYRSPGHQQRGLGGAQAAHAPGAAHLGPAPHPGLAPAPRAAAVGEAPGFQATAAHPTPAGALPATSAVHPIGTVDPHYAAQPAELAAAQPGRHHTPLPGLGGR